MRDVRARGTYVHGPHPRGYAQPGEGAPLLDVTRMSPSVGGAAGSMISSGTDVNRFLGALLRGELLRPAELREMRALPASRLRRRRGRRARSAP
ncbi:hypothetical protein [Streptomyces tendae]|uniref:hypothetical protein n=1 Tax=Streptomyces tendae TaxID=1932 RepID=UPI00367BDCDC